MAEVTHITWHPNRTEPTEESASMQVDMSDGTQILVEADTDVSAMPDLVQSLKPILFPQVIVMPVTYELLEEFTGTRTIKTPDPENEGETKSVTTSVSDINVRFTCSETDKTHERTVNVCFDADGEYDADATAVRIGEVAMGVGNKMANGVIT